MCFSTVVEILLSSVKQMMKMVYIVNKTMQLQFLLASENILADENK